MEREPSAQRAGGAIANIRREIGYRNILVARTSEQENDYCFENSSDNLMILGSSFIISLGIGLIARWVSFGIILTITNNRRKAQIVGSIFHLTMHIATTAIIAPLTFDITGVILTSIYVAWLLITYAFVEKAISIFYRISNSVKDALMSETPIKPTATVEEKSSTTIGIFIKTTSCKVLKGVFYQILIRFVVLGLSIKLLKLIEKITESFIEGVVEAIAGGIGKTVGDGCLFLLIKIPRYLLEAITAGLDVVFDYIFPD